MKRQLVHTYDDIVSLENLCLAWQEFVVGKIYKPDVQLFGRHLMDHIVELNATLVNRTYCHGDYESFYVNDPKRRHIHKASVRDRLLHHAVYRILYPFFDSTFIADSYSCRVGKGMHRAINRFCTFANQVSHNQTRTGWVLKCDIRKFFASVDHKILLDTLSQYIPDQDILWLLRNIVGSFYIPHCSHHPTPATAGCAPPLAGGESCGLPLGNLTSQLFANVYMNRFDQWIKHAIKAKYYIRYADDFVFFSHDREYLIQLISLVHDFLSKELQLTLHPNKISLATLASGIDFLGWIHFPDHRVLRQTTRRRMLARIKNNPTQETVQSYLGLLTHGNTKSLEQEVRSLAWLAQ